MTDEKLGRNDVAKAVKRICEKRDQGFAILSQGCEGGEENLTQGWNGEGGKSGKNDVAKAVKKICEKRDQGFAILSQA